MRAWLLVLVAGACGRLGFEPRTAPADGPGPMEDAALDTVDAAPLGMFGAPMLVASLTDPALDDDPTLPADQLELYFNSDRAGGAGGADIWVSTRATVTSVWSAPAPVVELNAPGRETDPEISLDGLTIWFASDRAGGLGMLDIWIATRPDRTSTWSVPILVPELNSTENDGSATTDPTQRMMTMQSRRAGNEDLFFTTRPSIGAAWATPASIAALDTVEDETAPFLGPGGLTLYFSAVRSGAQDLYVSSRPSLADTFGAPEPIVELNSASIDNDPWLSPDGHVMFFSSDRSGNSEIYEAVR